MGCLKVCAPVGFPAVERARVLRLALAVAPDLELDVAECGAPLSHADGEFDLLMHFGAPPASGAWFSRVIRRVPVGLVAAKEYLDRVGRPERLAALSTHPLFLWSVGGLEPRSVPLAGGGWQAVDPWMSTPNAELVRAAARAGAGVALVPLAGQPFHGSDEGLERLLVGEVEGEVQLRMLATNRRARNPRIDRVLSNIEAMGWA